MSTIMMFKNESGGIQLTNKVPNRELCPLGTMKKDEYC
jgi:hypothetical protein